MGAQASEVKLSEFIAARQMPRRLFEELPEVEHGDALTYVGWVETAYTFIAQRKEGEFVRVNGDSVWDALASKYRDSQGCLSDDCCTGDLYRVRAEFHWLYERLPQISLK